MIGRSFNNFFEDKVNHALESLQGKTVVFFKGFAMPQIKFLINHNRSLLYDNTIIKDGFVDIRILNEKWLDMVQNISSSDHPLVGFYEELIVLRELIPKLQISKILIIENNTLEPWTPCVIKLQDALALFDYLQQEQETKSDNLILLSQFYGDVRLIDDMKALLLPITIEESNIELIPFFEEKKDLDKGNKKITNEIVIGSSEDWSYRIALLEGNLEPAHFIKKEKYLESRYLALVGALTELGIDFSFEKEEPFDRVQSYDEKRFQNLLNRYWGEDASFRQLLFYADPDRSHELESVSQGKIIAEIVEQCENARNGSKYNNIFITAPTGSGKSILFQLSALYLAEKYEIVTIVVSPLIALMNDQVNQLEKERGISIAACMNSTMSMDDRMAVINKIQSGEKSLLYLAPELLLTTHLETLLAGRKMGLLVIDEAHTVTSWGRDFRSDYWFLGDFIKKCNREGMRFPVLCLTATAVYSGENDVVNDTINELGLGSTVIHLGNVKRNNIDFDIVFHENTNLNTDLEETKLQMVLTYIRECVNRGQKVLAYFPYRSQVEAAYEKLDENERKFIRRYHGQIFSEERKITEKEYKSGDVRGLVCTKAFGMGVDVSDIRHIVHFAPTGTLSDYIQEIGRAARDPKITGIAHIDYFGSDLRYVRSLNGISEMRQYQLKEMLKKIYSLYEEKKHRNLLISSETFEYLFNEKEVENRTKSGLMLIAKDLSNKYSFPVLIVKPKAMLSKNYICVPKEIEGQFLRKYKMYSKRADGDDQRILLSQNNKYCSDVHVCSSGDTYLVDMAGIWENYFTDMTFGMFKKIFFDQRFDASGETYKLAPRVRVEVKFLKNFEIVEDECERLVTALCQIFSHHIDAEKKQFTLKIFEEELLDILGDIPVEHNKMRLLLDIFAENVDENATYSKSRNQVRVLRKRKQAKLDETIYFVSSKAYHKLPNYFRRLLVQCRPSEEQNTFSRFYPMMRDKPIEIMPLIRLLELAGLARYEIRGGEKAEVFIRLNDPEKIKRLAQGNYKNEVLQSIHNNHKYNERLMSAFFREKMSTEERWDLIEQYFLGNERFVEQRLRIE